MNIIAIDQIYEAVLYSFIGPLPVYHLLTVRIPDSVLSSLLRGPCKKFCHWVRITSVLRFIKYIFITNLQSISPSLKHIFVTFIPSCEKQINSLRLVSVGDTDK